MTQILFGACELKRKVTTALFAAALLGFIAAPIVVAQEHVQEAGHAPAEHSIGDMIIGMAWPVANFIIFLGVLYYFFNKPFAEYLSGRSTSIRKDLVEAAELKSRANAQLAAIDQKLQDRKSVV